MARTARRCRRLWVRGIFGDPKARVIGLNRPEKRHAAVAVACRWAIEKRGLGFRKASRCSAKSDTLGRGSLYFPYHGGRPCRHPLNLAHVSMVHAGHLSIVPSDCDRIPACFGDNATISGIASPINAGALLEFLNSSTVIIASPVHQSH